MNDLHATCAEIDSEWSGRRGETGAGGSSARKILVPISQSQRSHEALTLALLLAQAPGTELVLLHAVELNIAGEERGIGRGKLLHELMRAAESRLMELGRSMCGEVPFSVVVCEGPPGEVILQMARTMDVDTLVMGPRRPRGLGWMRRNNLRTVVRQTPLPVYIVGPTGIWWMRPEQLVTPQNPVKVKLGESTAPRIARHLNSPSNSACHNSGN